METRIPHPFLHLLAFFVAYIAGLVAFAYLCGCSGQAFTASGGVVHETGDAASSGGATGTGGVSVGAGGAGGARATGGAHPTSGGAPSTGGVATATGGAVASTGGTSAADGGLGDARATGGSSSGDAGEACVTDLSGVGTGDFRISFTLTMTGYTALVNQRAGCDQTSVWWQALVDSGGGIAFNTCDGSGACATIQTCGLVNDGLQHRIVLARVAGALSCSKDGVIRPGVVPDAYSFGAFGAPLRIGTDDCGDTPLAGHGTLTDLCVSL